MSDYWKYKTAAVKPTEVTAKVERAFRKAMYHEGKQLVFKSFHKATASPKHNVVSPGAGFISKDNQAMRDGVTLYPSVLQSGLSSLVFGKV